MKNIDVDMFLLCRPRYLITSPYYDRIENFSLELDPLSITFDIQKFITDTSYIKFSLVSTDKPSFRYIQRIQDCLYETIRFKTV